MKYIEMCGSVIYNYGNITRNEKYTIDFIDMYFEFLILTNLINFQNSWKIIFLWKYTKHLTLNKF